MEVSNPILQITGKEPTISNPDVFKEQEGSTEELYKKTRRGTYQIEVFWGGIRLWNSMACATQR